MNSPGGGTALPTASLRLFFHLPTFLPFFPFNTPLSFYRDPAAVVLMISGFACRIRA